MEGSESFLTRAQKLNLETGQLRWPELERHFARGVVVVVSPELDLLDIAAAFVDDNSVRVQKLLADHRVWKAELEDAALWQNSDVVLWAVVAAPWVLVQSAV